MNKPLSPLPQDQVFWYLQRQKPQMLLHSTSTDVVIIGGGMAGLSAAQAFRSKGLDVMVLEQYFCGGGATGKSSGFLTPESELNVSHLVDQYGPEQAHKLWEFVSSGVKLVENNIRAFGIDCDYQVQDCLVVANNMRAMKKLQHEYAARKQLGYNSTLYSPESVATVINTSTYAGGVGYDKTFGISAYRYTLGMRDILINTGVQIFEETPVIKIHADGVSTARAHIKAKYIIVCADRFIPDLRKLTKDIYHAQTFLLMSAPLPEHEVKKIFPDKKFMVWDTDLIYQYYRINGDNRLTLGGGSIFSTYAQREQYHAKHIADKLISYFKKTFPHVQVQFECFWPGLIGVSKDILPIAGFDDQNPNIYYIGAAAGLPWAAALGAYSAEKIIDNVGDLDHYFAPTRKYPLGHFTQNIIGTRATFALSNAKTLYLS